VWGEIRNFKKCLIMMFAKQDKEVVFLETVMGLAQQRRHCMVECIPVPKDIAKEAPLYFKKVSCRTLLYSVVLHCSSLSLQNQCFSYIYILEMNYSSIKLHIVVLLVLKVSMKTSGSKGFEGCWIVVEGLGKWFFHNSYIIMRVWGNAGNMYSEHFRIIE